MVEPRSNNNGMHAYATHKFKHFQKECQSLRLRE